MHHGYLVLVLHAHLPYVLGHGRWPYGAEWLYEASCETYIPLLNVLNRLSREGKKAGFTVGLTPVLCEMLASNLFKGELKDYIRKRIALAGKDKVRFSEAGETELASRADQWALFYESALHDFTATYKENLLEAFKGFQNDGQIEIITSSATHAYLPMVGTDRCISAQVRQGVKSYESFFGSQPKGIWLPECGYRPASSLPSRAPTNGHGAYRKGIEEILAENGIEYFFLDTHLLGAGRPIDENRLGLLESLSQSNADIHEDMGFGDLSYCGSMGHLQGRQESRGQDANVLRQYPKVQADHLAPHFAGSQFSDQVCAFFTREPAVSMQVWSQDHGYPGDSDYLEFHKKDSTSGLRYWKVTDRAVDLGGKEIYWPQKAASKVRSHAAHFVSSVSSLLSAYHAKTGEPGVLTAPFDAELFGHWWFEGVQWLETVVELLAKEPEIQLSQPREILRNVRPKKTLMLPEGSWGQGGCHTMWYNKETAWMWQIIHRAERAMHEALNRGRPLSSLSERILRQMGRELLLLQASDWQFLVTTKTAGEYAESRFCGHEENFFWLQKLLDQSSEDAVSNTENLERLAAIEQKDPVFDSIKLSLFEERTENGL
jgi:1,4-alpha-glucan branching enzyme